MNGKPIIVGRPPRCGKSVFAQRMGEARRAKGWSQRVFADKLGVCFTTVQYWENDKRRPNIDFLVAVAKLLGVSTDWLLGVKK